MSVELKEQQNIIKKTIKKLVFQPDNKIQVAYSLNQKISETIYAQLKIDYLLLFRRS